MKSIINKIKFSENGLVPVIAQDEKNGEVLMFAFANRESVDLTVSTGYAHFWSRTRKKLWKKGETSGNVLLIKNILIDCDEDCLVYLVTPNGPACHTGEATCFHRDINNQLELATRINSNIPNKVYEVIRARKKDPDNQSSYTSSLFREGLKKILEKVDEESKEFIEASEDGDKEKIIYECTDLLFHMMVAIAEQDIEPSDIYRELYKRFGKKKKDYTLDE